MTGIERLRKLSEDMLSLSLWVRLTNGTEKDWDCYQGDGRTLNDELLRIADQIEREQDAMVADSPYEALPPEDREAVAWVRDHGGLDHVREEWRSRSNLKRMYEKEKSKVERQQRHIEFVQGKCRERQGHIVELSKELAELRKVLRDYRDALGGMCERLGITDGTSLPEMPDVICEALDRRLMPEGCEWPRYESGELVGFGDDVSRHGEDFEANVIALYRDGSFSLNFWAYSKGERVRRPTVLAADGEPLEKGQTVYLPDGTPLYVTGIGDMTEGHQTVFGKAGNDIADCEWEAVLLTHQRPVLDADGNRIEPAMDVWWVCEGDRRGVHAERLHVDGIDDDGEVECSPYNGGTSVVLEPSELYVNKPVLDADGVPIKEGDTVWRTSDAREFEVTGIDGAFAIRVRDESMEIGVWTTPCGFTHAKPESPDSRQAVVNEIGDEMAARIDLLVSSGRWSDAD